MSVGILDGGWTGKGAEGSPPQCSACLASSALVFASSAAPLRWGCLRANVEAGEAWGSRAKGFRVIYIIQVFRWYIQHLGG